MFVIAYDACAKPPVSAVLIANYCYAIAMTYLTWNVLEVLENG